MGLKIFSIFRRYNILEFKRPDDLSEAVPWNVSGYAGFRAISKKPKPDDVRYILSEVLSEKDSDVIGWYRDYLDLFSKLDNEMIEDIKRRYPEMART